MGKRILAVLVALWMLLGAYTSVLADGFEPYGDAESAYDDQLEQMQTCTTQDWIYTLLDDGSAMVMRYEGEASDLTVPEALDGHPVTAIGSFCLAAPQTLQTVTLPGTITVLKTDAFMYCTAIAINLNSGLQTIEDTAFFGCDQLAEITIPATVQSIGEEAFENCESLLTVTLMDGVREIKTGAFDTCEALRDVTVPPSVHEIGENAFPIREGFTLRVVDGSFAQAYGNANGIAMTIISTQ